MTDDRKRYVKPLNIKKHSLSAHVPSGPGEILPNEAVIIEEKIIRQFTHRQDSIVLAIIPGKFFQQFVTWHRQITTDSPLATSGYQIVDTCSWGHYARDIRTALREYDQRVSAKERMFDLDGSLVRT